MEVVSRSKFLLEDDMIVKCFEKAGITGITSISTLGAGEYNAVYEAVADKHYVLKVAPDPKRETQIYERDLMKSEVYWYEVLKEKTNIRTPEVYYSDFSCEVVPTYWFIMEKIEGAQMDSLEMNEEERAQAVRNSMEIVADFHRVHHDTFGYIQNDQHDNWYLALRSMILNLLEDARVKGYDSENGQKFLAYVDRHQVLFEQAECCMTSFDIWESNIMCNRQDGQIISTWIDPERCFWGDRIMDFICFEMDKALMDKTETLKAYNAIAELPITGTRGEKVRYAAAQALMGLIMEVERYYRYTPELPIWSRNSEFAKFFFKQAFAVFEEE